MINCNWNNTSLNIIHVKLLFNNVGIVRYEFSRYSSNVTLKCRKLVYMPRDYQWHFSFSVVKSKASWLFEGLIRNWISSKKLTLSSTRTNLSSIFFLSKSVGNAYTGAMKIHKIQIYSLIKHPVIAVRYTQGYDPRANNSVIRPKLWHQVLETFFDEIR